MDENTFKGSDVLKGVPTTSCDNSKRIEIFTQREMLPTVKISKHLYVEHQDIFLEKKKRKSGEMEGGMREDWTGDIPLFSTIAMDRACRELQLLKRRP